MYYDAGYWNGGQRPAADLIAAWSGLILGEHSEHPLAALGVSEVGDQVKTLRRCADKHGLDLVLGPDGVADGRKEALFLNPALVERKGDPIRYKVGNVFQGRRHGRDDRVRMANKYVVGHEVTDLRTGWTPTHLLTHVWPSVTLNAPQVRQMVENTAGTLNTVGGTLIFTLDANMAPDHALMAAMRDTGLVCSQVRYGPEGTFGNRKTPIDQGWVRESGHYKMTGQTLVVMPGHERGGDKGHKALIVHGKMPKRPGWIAPNA